MTAPLADADTTVAWCETRLFRELSDSRLSPRRRSVDTEMGIFTFFFLFFFDTEFTIGRFLFIPCLAGGTAEDVRFDSPFVRNGRLVYQSFIGDIL